jgi:hypothetical protein
MSKHINVNPDHYKVAGRERPGTVVARAPKPRSEADRKAMERWEKKRKGRT